MKHRIETNVTFTSDADLARVRSVIFRKVEGDQINNVRILTPTGSPIVVELEGNGALLRDAAYALDVAGYLD